MTDTDPQPLPARRASRPVTGPTARRLRVVVPWRLAALALAVGVVGAGCVGAGSSTPGPATADAAPTSSASPAPAITPSTQTSTEWGRIWDGLPTAFPVEPGAEPVPDPSGPASATLAIPVAVATARDWWQRALGTAGYSTVGTAGPLEDGSVVIESSGAGDCRVQVRLAPAGPGTTATILYGAACPFV